MTPALVIFDLDGTLVDTAPDIARAVGAALAEIGVAQPPLDVVKRWVGDGARELIRRVVAAHPGVAPRGETDLEETLFHRFLASYRDHLCVDSRPYPGAVDAVAALRAAGLALAVVTNKPGDLARRLLATLNLASELDPIIGDGDGFPRKPDPAAALSLSARLGISPDRTVVVGDGLPDVRMAHALGARAIGATWGYVSAAQLAAESPAFLADTFEAAVRFVIGSAGGEAVGDGA